MKHNLMSTPKVGKFSAYREFKMHQKEVVF